MTEIKNITSVPDATASWKEVARQTGNDSNIPDVSILKHPDYPVTALLHPECAEYEFGMELKFLQCSR